MIKFDKHRQTYEVLKKKQFDTLEKLNAAFFSNGVAINLDGYTVTLECLKSDNTVVIQENNIVIKNTNEVEVKLNEQITIVGGDTECQFVLTKDGLKDTTFTFYINVQRSVVEGGIKSSSVITLLDDLTVKLGQARIVKQETEALIQNGGAATKGELAKTNESLAHNVNELINRDLLIESKSSEALAKANNPYPTLVSSGFKVSPNDLTAETLSLINKGGSVNIGQGLLSNQGSEYPLVRVVKDGNITTAQSKILMDVFLDIKVINANPNKVYQISYVGNGSTIVGENAKYGFTITEHDKNSFATNSNIGKRTQCLNTDIAYDTPSNVITRVINGKFDGVKFILTIDYSKFGSNTFLNQNIFGSYIIHENNYILTDRVPKSIQSISSVDYPLKKFLLAEKDLHPDVSNAIIDVKVINAKPNKLYKIEYIGNGTTAWGNPEYAIYLNEYDSDMSNPRVVFDRVNAHLDAPSENLENRFISTMVEDVILSITIDYSKLLLPNYTLNSVGGAGKGHIIDKNCYIYKKEESVTESNSSPYQSAVWFNEEQDIFIKIPYSQTENAVLNFNKLGINQITHLKKFSLCTENVITLNFDNPIFKYDITSDWLSPYGIKALTNQVNDNFFTVGGNHGSDGATGIATSQSIKTEVFVDGIKIPIGTKIGATNCIEILTKNFVYAPNVIDISTGAHRNSMLETVLYKIYKDTIYVTVTIEALEDIELSYYTGIQVTAPPLSMQDRLYFMLEDVNNDYKITDYTGLEILSCAKKNGILDRFNYYGTSHMLVGYKDKFVGLSDGSKLSDDDFPVYKSTGVKVYLHNIIIKNPQPTTLLRGDIAYWNGGYTFSSTGLNCTGCKRAYTIREKDKRVYCIDFDKTTPTTYLETYLEDRGKFINVIHKSNTVTCDNYITSKGLRVFSTGYGQLKFTID